MGKLRRRLLAFLIVGYVLTAAYYWHYQRWYIMMPEREIEATPEDFGLSYQEVWLTVGAGSEGQRRRIHGWWLPADATGAPALLYLHGGGRNISKAAVHASRFRRMGFGVLLVDYRGSGLSDGDLPSEDMMYADAEAAWEHLRTLQPDSRRRYIYGHSVGSAVALDLAVRVRDASGVIVESAFTSMADLIKTGWYFKLFPVELLLNQRFDALARIGALHTPVLFLHGARDEVVPSFLGERLYSAAPRPKTWVQIPGGGHSNNMVVAAEQYRAAVQRFVQETSGAPVAGRGANQTSPRETSG